MKKVICFVFFFIIFSFLNTILSLVWVPPHDVVYLYIWTFTGIISLLICKRIYDWLEYQEKGLLPPRRRATIVMSIVFIATCVIGIRYWDEHREKSLKDLLEMYSYPKEVWINPTTSNAQNVNNPENIRDLMDFLSQYQIQKSDTETGLSGPLLVYSWDNEKGWRGPIWARLMIKEHAILVNENYYKVLNGPIDTDWLQKYNEKNRE